MIYVHVPFCRSFCTYCDFYSVILCRGRSQTPSKLEAYVSALENEIASRRSQILSTLELNTLYIGGGTPSVLPPSILERIVRALPSSDYSEFTLEVNPDDIVHSPQAYLRSLKALGVNRISMGVQSFDDGVLKKMNRRHDSALALKAFSLLRSAGFDNISLDLIFGGFDIDSQILASTLRTIVELRPEHISAYQLSIEEGSILARMCEKGQYRECPDELCAEQYNQICTCLAEAGYEHYEISSWALDSKRSQHNSAYWSRLPYVGLGPGAHSLIGNCRSWNSEMSPSDGLWTSEAETLSPAQIREEQIMLALRTCEGVEKDLLDSSLACKALSEGLLERVGSSRVRIPESRFFVSDSIISSLI